MQKRFIKVISFIVVLIAVSSCYSNRRLVYLQDKDFSEEKRTLVENEQSLYRVQPNDILSVQIKSSAESEISNLFNVGSLQNAVMASPANFFLEGYSVNHTGNITLPVVGAVAVKGLTVDEARTAIQKRVDEYLNNATVLVKLTSFRITVLGEVRSPGQYYVYNSRATVLEALGMAGDLTAFGSRENVKLIRQVPTGSEVILLDLTDPRLLQSDFYYMSPGDVVYVEPLRSHTKRTNIEVLSVVFSAVTTAVLIMSYVNSQ
jgi:polysaccharide export outer membrane protein